MPREKKKRTNKIPSEKTRKSIETKKKLEEMGIQIPNDDEIRSVRLQSLETANQKNVEMGYSSQKKTIKIAHQANAAMDYSSQKANLEAGRSHISKEILQANSVKGRKHMSKETLKANAANARSHIVDTKANAANARSQIGVRTLINNSNLPDGSKQLFKDLKYSKEDVELAIDLHNYDTNQQSQNQTSSIKSASPVRSPAKSASPVRSPSHYLDDF
jgi:hypothetical protein